MWGTVMGQGHSGTHVGHSKGPRAQWDPCEVQQRVGRVRPVWGMARGQQHSWTCVGHREGLGAQWDLRTCVGHREGWESRETCMGRCVHRGQGRTKDPWTTPSASAGVQGRAGGPWDLLSSPLVQSPCAGGELEQNLTLVGFMV